MNIKYTLGAILTIPILPVLYYQGKKIKASIPRLPEAKDPEGKVMVNSQKTLKIISIGESTIAGVGADTHREAFTGTLANELASHLTANIDWKVYAKSGYTAQQVNDKIIDKIIEKEIDLIVIGLGANDAFQLNSPTKWKRSVERLIEKIQAKFNYPPIVFVNMPPIKDFPAFTSLIKFTVGNLVNILGNELSEIIPHYKKTYFHSKRLVFEDFINKSEKDITIDDLFSDGVHPSKLTYQAWAKEITSFILDNKIIEG